MQMEELFEKLRNLQDVLTERIALEQEVKEIPKVLHDLEEALSRSQKNWIDRNDEWEDARKKEAELKKELNDADYAREKAERSLSLTATQREYETVEKEKNEAAEKEQAVRKELLKAQKVVEDIGREIKESEALIAQQKADIAEQRAKTEAETCEKNVRIAALAKQEKQYGAGLDPEVLFKFERIIRNKMGKGIVAVKGGVCTGCHMVLPAQLANEVRHVSEQSGGDSDIVFCPYCSRILFYEQSEEDSEAFYADEPGSLSDLDDIEDMEEEEEEEEESAAFGDEE